MTEDMKTVTGSVTIKGITKEIKLNTEYNGMSVDPWGNTKHGWEITGTINRNDFGLTWNAPLETGGVLVSEKVTLTLDIQMSETVEQTVEQEA
jgi:polyisoprenoid-binding protein YceI